MTVVGGRVGDWNSDLWCWILCWIWSCSRRWSAMEGPWSVCAEVCDDWESLGGGLVGN